MIQHMRSTKCLQSREVNELTNKPIYGNRIIYCAPEISLTEGQLIDIMAVCNQVTYLR